MLITTQLKLVSRPSGLPNPDNWTIETNPVEDLSAGQVLVRNEYLSIDPAMRGYLLNRADPDNFVAVGQVMRALGAGQVIDSKDRRFQPGDFVAGGANVQTYGLIPGNDLTKIDPNDLALPVYLGTLGLTGMTAYFGLLKIGQPRRGETVVISGASGAVGSVAGQLAKLLNCRTIGITSSDAKCDYVINTLGFDDCINYRTTNVRRALKKICPDGIDVYFDNVGGDILNTALTHLRAGARIVLSGAISQYNNESGIMQGPSFYVNLILKNARMEGFVVLKYMAEFPAAVQQMKRWIEEGKLTTDYSIINGGIPAFNDALLKLFNGEKLGKLVLKVNG